MTDAIATHFTHALDRSTRSDTPYPHWLLTDALPDGTCRAILALPVPPPEIGDTEGRRETNNSTRVFVSPELRAAHPAADSLAGALQAPATISTLHRTCGLDLTGTFLRIEYCQDRDGFWLEPHTDIGAKLFTMLIYLSEGDAARNWGTDILDADHNLVGRADADFNTGLIFLPAADTWHGFERRPIDGIRRSLIVNYVRPEWRDRDQLAFPDQPVGAAA